MEDSWTLAIILIKAGLYATSLVAAGTTLFLITVRPNGPDIHAPTRLYGGLAALAALSFLILHIVVQAGFLADDGIAGMIDGDMINIILDGPSGLTSKILLLGLVILLMISFIPITSSIYPWVAGSGSLFIAISFTLSGHTTNAGLPLSAGVIAIHLFAISFWLSALWPLYQQAKHFNKEALISTAETFGKQAMVIVPMLLLAGLVLSVFLVGSLTALFTTAYGMFLIGKIVLVVFLLGLAALNKYRFIPAIRDNEPNAINHFSRSIQLEVLLFSIILLITAVLTSTLNLPIG